MAKKTTVKAIALKYGTVGGDATTPLMGVLKGLTIGTIKKDEDGALNFSVTITALNYTTGTGAEAVDHMYKIVGTAPA